MSLALDPQLEKKLNALLATEATLYFKTKKAHWLVTGPTFKELHELLDGQAEFILSTIDEVAERVTMLGGLPAGSLGEFKEQTLVQDFAAGSHKVEFFLKALLADHERLISSLKETIELSGEKNDPGTEDLLTQRLQEHEKAAWFLRATLETR